MCIAGKQEENTWTLTVSPSGSQISLSKIMATGKSKLTLKCLA